MLGDCYQKSKEVVLGSTTIINNHIQTGFSAEAIACLQVIQLGIDLGFQDVVIEDDSLMRYGNQVAHLLAVEGLRGEKNTYLLDGVPNFTEEAVEKDPRGTVGEASLVL
ncbi:hypothetical protein Gogos_016702 [Gossypium gossypioides]|uniref:RNase H type-1 domain-containing protein n=1 Tax=Gossypium gossypioides TaxID=34282 RepID=A0A7J9B8I8_GOSGO|nr:hypothetical protein [Gossypium gossypioides]